MRFTLRTLLVVFTMLVILLAMRPYTKPASKFVAPGAKGEHRRVLSDRFVLVAAIEAAILIGWGTLALRARTSANLPSNRSTIFHFLVQLKEFEMSPRDLFGVLLRVLGLWIAYSGLSSLRWANSPPDGYSLREYLLKFGAEAALGIVMFLLADNIAEFSYSRPRGERSEEETEGERA